jgi:hypothetical protein
MSYIPKRTELGLIQPLTIVPRNALLERNLERDSEAALSLTGEWERLLPVQINLWPDFQRIPRRAP